MEKIITLNDKKIRMKASAYSALIYRANFGEDIFPAQAKLIGFASSKNFNDINTVDLLRMAWSFAKTADKEVIPFEQWVEEVGDFPVLDILPQIAELITANITSTTKIKNQNAATKK